MSEINVQIEGGSQAQLTAPVSVAEALKTLDRDAAKQALAAHVNGREVLCALCGNTYFTTITVCVNLPDCTSTQRS